MANEAAKCTSTSHRLALFIFAISEIEPRNATEAMLAAQMIACHDAPMNFLCRATVQDQSVEFVDLNVLRATRLRRLFGEQLEAMQRLKGKAGQQRNRSC